MKYYFTTLAVNEFYFQKSLEMHLKLNEKTQNALFNITTTKKDLEKLETLVGLTIDDFYVKYPKIKITTIEDLNKRFNFPLEMEGQGFIFNLNLKSLSIKACLISKENFDFLIFTDGDWGIYDGFDESKFIRFFDEMNKNNLDFVFERPAKIGDFRKNNFQDCFFTEKLHDYDLMDNTIWDEAEVVNEQFLAFKNNTKLKTFSQKWEQMLWYSIANNIRNYPDGFEIGVAALESKMKYDFHLYKLLNECFYFYPKYSETKHIRF